MARLIVIRPDGAETVIDSDADRSVMEVIRDEGIDELLAMCGGCCSCATCHVHVDPAFMALLPAMQGDELDMLESAGQRAAHSRLSCQIPFSEALDGLRVTVVSEG